MLKNGARLWRQAYLQVKMLKTWELGPLLDVRSGILHGAVAPSAFASENVNNILIWTILEGPMSKRSPTVSQLVS